MPCSIATLEQCFVGLNAPGFVDGWIDFNADGDWNDRGEHVLQNVEFTATTLDQTFSSVFHRHSLCLPLD